ncbi:MAG: lipoate--protein ligase family protein [Gammaproteobacteria bacterium]|nr:lipoate--protein ligase family protein [Gammaproteobacteria bacterium]
MKPKFRLIIDQPNPGAFNMGIDEAILDQVIQHESPPTLRFYQWNPAMLSIGYFQNMAEEVDLDACQKLGVDCIRRTTGGGAVLHEHEVTYSFIAPIGYANIPEAILDSYQCICEGIVLGLKQFGINALFAPLNDIVVNHQKISGNAQTRRRGVILQHGTILLDVDIEKMFSLLKVPSEKLKDKMIQDVKKRVIGLNQLLKFPLTYSKTVDALIFGFEQALHGEFQEGKVSSQELTQAQAYIRTKYANPNWNNS